MALILTGGAAPTIGTAAKTDAFTIASTGSTLPKKVPVFSALSTGLDWYTPLSPYILKFNTVIKDNYSGYDTTNFRYTAPISGIYFVSFYTLMSGAGGWTFYKNGALIPGLANGIESRLGLSGRLTTTGIYGHAAASVNVYLAAGEYIDVRQQSQIGWQVFGSDVNCFCGHLVSLT